MCEINFERTVIEEGEEVKCPCCGAKDIKLGRTEEKKPDSCNTSAKYT